MVDNLERIATDLERIGQRISLADSIALTDARIHLIQAYATLELANQQRAANLLVLARTGISDVASTVDLNAARKLIAPQGLNE